MKIGGTGSRSFELLESDHKERIFNDLLDHINVIAMNANSTSSPQSELVIVSGGAEGWDDYLTRAAQALDLAYELILPSRSYLEYYWKHHSVTGADHYHAAMQMLEGAASVKYTSDLYEDHSKQKGHGDLLYVNQVHINILRNAQMVREADVFLVYDPVGNPSSKGTKSCLQLVKRAGKPWKEFK